MNLEAAVISSICDKKDISTLLAANIDEVFVSHGDVLDGLKSYYQKYRSVPDVDIIVDRYPDFEPQRTTGETAFYLDQLKNEYVASQVRQILIATGTQLKTDTGPRVLEKLQNEVATLTKFSASAKDVDMTDTEAALKHFQAVKERSAMMNGSPGIQTGFKAIDVAYHTGMGPGHLVNVIGWPGRSKTWTVLWLAVQVWLQGYKPLVVSLEMTPETMRDRIYTLMGSGMFEMRDLSRGDLNQDDFMEWARKYMADKNNFVVVSSEGVQDVTPNFIQGKVDQHKPDLVIVDYHQLISDNSKSQNATVRAMEASKELKRLAVRNNIPVVDILAATADDSTDRDRPPMLSDVAWSKAIEYDSDHAFAVHRDDETGIIEIVCRKNRHGELYSFMVESDLGRGIYKEIYG